MTTILIILAVAAGAFLAPIAFAKFVIFGGSRMTREDLEDMKATLEIKAHICTCMENVANEFKDVQKNPAEAFIRCKASGRIDEFMALTDRLGKAIEHTTEALKKKDEWWLQMFRDAGRNQQVMIENIMKDDVDVYTSFHNLVREIWSATDKGMATSRKTEAQ